MPYTQSQLRAIETIDQNLQIIACAGSGKTQVISRRIVKILEARKSAGIRPEHIVAFTFTEKAAGELKDRIHKLAREHLGTDDGLAAMYVGTIHGYCLNLLQQPPVYDFLKYSVLTEVQQRLLIDRYSARSGLTEVPTLDGDTLRRWRDSRLYQTLLSVLEEGGVKTKLIPAGVRDAVAKYRQLLDEKKYLDYSGMLRRAVSELKSNARLREKIRASVRYLVVDEYQDVNPLQEALIREIAELGANLCVVGDDDQTIYQWRGSDVQNIITFAKRYPHVRTERLNENFRSSRSVVATARRIIEKNPDRLDKRMESAGAQEFSPGDILALEFPDYTAEAKWIAEKIEWLRGTEYLDPPDRTARGLTYSDMAILVRAWKDAGPIVEALRSRGIPYVGGGMNSLLDTPEAQALREAFYFLANHVPRGQPAVTEARLRRSLEEGFPGLPERDLSSGIAFLRDIRQRIPLGSDSELFLQRVFLDFLEALSIREERIGARGRTGEVIFFNLGKFSQLISDFERIHFNSRPIDLYGSFAGFLEHQAADYYPEETEDTVRTRPDAVSVMTVHQAKGMQWPAVFVPCLRANRFPSRRPGGRSVWHILPERAVPNAERYQGTEEDERRLFYVALTRAEKYLFCSWGPIPNNQQQRRVSKFFTELASGAYVLAEDCRGETRRLQPQPRVPDTPLTLTFSELRYYFQCPYQFKLRFLYGFDAPVNRALGFGKSLHDALCEIHAEAIRGRIVRPADVPALVQRHLHLPFANEEVRDNLVRSAEKALRQYLDKHGEHLTRLEHAEQVIELQLGHGLIVSGRIDLIRRTDTNQTAIVDFKSRDGSQAHDMTLLQLQLYAEGYRKVSGKGADLLEIHLLEEDRIHREEVNESAVRKTLHRVIEAGRQIRDVNLPKLEQWCETCMDCDMRRICRAEPASSQRAKTR
jgi:DNA helicase-2/ATP-dependent DNA helicase PcrA